MARAAHIFATIDVHYFDDDKVLASGSAWQLHLAAILTCKRTLSDGMLTRRQLERIAPESLSDTSDAIATLIDVGLFEEIGEYIYVASWDTWNDPAADVEARSKGGRMGNHKRWHVGRGIKDPGCEWCFPDIAA
jgi:hypothetical protein